MKCVKWRESDRKKLESEGKGTYQKKGEKRKTRIGVRGLFGYVRSGGCLCCSFPSSQFSDLCFPHAFSSPSSS